MTTSQIASTIVTLVEKHLGTGFDPATDAALVGAVAEYLEEEVLGSQGTVSRRVTAAATEPKTAFARLN
ncbi:MAG TPA: hypothetical protein PKD23_04110 [Bellilinea sp.]|nr:hypothetical protein [Bellilinea sp.]